MRASEYLPVFEATRGDLVESIHLGAIAVVNNQGELLASWGDPAIHHLHAVLPPSLSRRCHSWKTTVTASTV